MLLPKLFAVQTSFYVVIIDTSLFTVIPEAIFICPCGQIIPEGFTEIFQIFLTKIFKLAFVNKRDEFITQLIKFFFGKNIFNHLNAFYQTDDFIFYTIDMS